MHVASGGAASLSSPLNIKEANCVARGHSTSHHLASGQEKKRRRWNSLRTPFFQDEVFNFFARTTGCVMHFLSGEFLPADLKFSSCPNDVDSDFYLQQQNTQSRNRNFYPDFWCCTTYRILLLIAYCGFGFVINLMLPKPEWHSASVNLPDLATYWL